MSSETPERPASAGTELLTGAAMGMLVGALVGLSTSPVVGSVLTALLALLGGFLGLVSVEIRGRRLTAGPWRIVGFAVLFTAAVVVGIHARVAGWLGTDLKPHIQELVEAGYPSSEARALVAYRYYGVVPEGATVAVNETSRQGTAGLFSGSAAVCNQLDRAREREPAERVAALASGGNVFDAMAERIGRAAPERQVSLLDAAGTLVCGH